MFFFCDKIIKFVGRFIREPIASMKELKYPIGIQSFPEIREGEYVYVDKTAFIGMMVKKGKYYFLGRPRRFGKSLLLSTIHAYFEGRRELFKNLAINSMDVSWIPRPVLHFDLNAENYKQPDGLDKMLNRRLAYYEKVYRIKDLKDSFAGRFEDLLMAAYEQTGQKAVVLVDEYDKPLLEIEDYTELFYRNQATLKGFFSVLKSMDDYVSFAMLTGVARFNKVSIFSDLNNLKDISMSDQYADICGVTETEFEQYFKSGVLQLSVKRGETYAETVEKMREYYDGYLFTPEGNRLYNPLSVLNALEDQMLDYYWFQTGTPTFLINRIKASKIDLPELNSQWTSRSRLLAIGLDDPDPVPLLFQTGYLTIKSTDGRDYELHFPNKEVETAFAEDLLPFYMPQMTSTNSKFTIRLFRLDLINGNPEGFMKRMQTLLKDMPYEQHSEKAYQDLVYLLFTLLGANTEMERHTSAGRADLVVKVPKAIYVFEFKYDGSAKAALKQIYDKDYAGRFALETLPVYLIGANFSDKEGHKGLIEWSIDKANKSV